MISVETKILFNKQSHCKQQQQQPLDVSLLENAFVHVEVSVLTVKTEPKRTLTRLLHHHHRFKLLMRIKIAAQPSEVALSVRAPV